MPAVGGGIELLAAVDFVIGPVKSAKCLGPCVTQPSRGVPYFSFHEHFKSITAAFSLRYNLLPILVGDEIGGAVAILQHVVHCFVVGLGCKIKALPVIIDAHAIKVALHQRDVFSDRNPDVAGHDQAVRHQAVDALRHVGIRGFNGEVVAYQIPQGQAGLKGKIGFVGDKIGTQSQAVVEFKVMKDGEIILSIKCQVINEHFVAVRIVDVLLVFVIFRIICRNITLKVKAAFKPFDRGILKDPGARIQPLSR